MMIPCGQCPVPDRCHAVWVRLVEKSRSVPGGPRMKVCWFHLMPYPYLPDDFKQKYRSVWVDVPSTLYDPAKGHVVYNDYLDELEFAEQVGFDGLCVNEHHA